MRILITICLVVFVSLVANTSSAQRRCPHGTNPDGTCKPPPPPPAPAVVELDVDPPGAQVFVLDAAGEPVPLGMASEPLPLAKIRKALGAAAARELRFTFVFKFAGYDDAQLSLHVKPTGATKSGRVALFRWPELVFEGHEVGTKVTVDGVAVKPGSVRRVPFGEHTIEAERLNYDDYTQTIVARRDGPSRIVHRLELHAKPCHVIVSRGDFVSVAVFINGESVGHVNRAQPRTFPCDGGKTGHVVELVAAPAFHFAHTIATKPAGVVTIDPPTLTPPAYPPAEPPDEKQLRKFEEACAPGGDRPAGIQRELRACQAVAQHELRRYDAHPDPARLEVARTYLEPACAGGEQGACLSLAFVLRKTDPKSARWRRLASGVCTSGQVYDATKARGCEFLYARADVNPTVYGSDRVTLKEEEWGVDLALMVMSGMNFLHDAKPIYQEFGLELVVRGPGAWKYFRPLVSYDLLRMRSLEGFDEIDQQRPRVYRAGIGLSLGFMLALGTNFVQLRAAGRGTLSFNDERNALGVDGGVRFAPTPAHTVDLGMLYETMPVRTANVEVLDQSFRLSDWTLVPLPYVRYRVSFVDILDL